jgi:hypothetical protein
LLTAKAPGQESSGAFAITTIDFKGVAVLRKIDWDLIQVIALVATMPVMLIIGALLPSFFANYG